MDPRAPSPVRVAYGSDKGENKEELLQPAERKARRTPATGAVDRNGDEYGCGGGGGGGGLVRATFPSSPTTTTSAAAAAAILSLEFQNLKRFHFASTHDNAAARGGGRRRGMDRTRGPGYWRAGGRAVRRSERRGDREQRATGAELNRAALVSDFGNRG